MMKKLLITGTVLFSLIAVSGCSSSNNEAGAKDEKITFAYWGDESENKAIQQVVSAFKEDYPEISVETQWIQKDYLTKMQVQIAGDTAADVYLISGGDLPGFSDNFKTQTLNEDEYINETVSEPMMIDGEAKAKPFIVKPKVMAINKDLFKEKSLTLPSSTEAMSTDEYSKLATALTDSKAEPTTYGSETLYFNNWIYSFGGSFYKNNGTESNFDSKEVIETADYLINLKKQGVFPSSEEADGQSMLEWFLSGRIGIYTDFGPWNIPQMKDVKGFDWDLVPFVANGGSKEINGLGITKNSDHLESAQIFVDYMCDNVEAQKIIGGNESAYGVPVLAEVADTFTKIYPEKNLQAFVDAASKQTPQETQKKTNEISSIQGTDLQSTQLQDGEKTPEEVFPELSKKITAIIQEK